MKDDDDDDGMQSISSAVL